MSAPQAAYPTLRSIEAAGGREAVFAAPDGARIRFAHWPAAPRAPNGTVVYLNGRTEFIEKYIEAAENLRDCGFDVWTLDWRGQGLSDKTVRNPCKGHIADYGQYLDDLYALIDGFVKPRPDDRLIMLGHSMGALIGLRFLHRHPSLFDCAVFSSPLVHIDSPGPFGPLTTKVMAWAGGRSALSRLYVPFKGDYQHREFHEDNVYTSDSVRFRTKHDYIKQDPRLAIGGPTLGWLHATHRSIAMLNDESFTGAIPTPMLFVTATIDDSSPQQQRLCSRIPNCHFQQIDGARHEILVEADTFRNRFWDLFDWFVVRAKAGAADGSRLVDG